MATKTGNPRGYLPKGFGEPDDEYLYLGKKEPIENEGIPLKTLLQLIFYPLGIATNVMFAVFLGLALQGKIDI